MRTRLTLLLVLTLCLLAFGRQAASAASVQATYIVNHTNAPDSDASDANLADGICDVDLATASRQCTLRAAIEQANFTGGGPHTINFDYGAGGPFLIVPLSPLPEINVPVTVDGTANGHGICAPIGNHALLDIVINGAFAGDSDGLVLGAGSDGSTIQGLVIVNFGGINGGDEITDGDAIRIYSSNNTIRCNFLGLDSDGDTGLGNDRSGVSISGLLGGGTGNTIGGPARADRNVIADNEFNGITLYGDSGSNTIINNYIGTDGHGVAAVPNGPNGIRLLRSDDNTIGQLGAGNTIANSEFAGINMDDDSQGNAIRYNSIHSNGTIGIDLEKDFLGDGVTANDLSDLDVGANGVQNFPVIEAADLDLGTITGRLKSIPSATFDLDFYTVNSCDASGHGEGRTHVGSTTVTTDVGGLANWTVSLTFVEGTRLTATATDAFGNTSEFSECFTVPQTEFPVGSAGDDTDAIPGDGVCDNGSGDCTLRAAIEEANAQGGGPHTIRFDIPGAGPHTIAPATPLPTITAEVIIDGKSQSGTTCPGADGTPADLRLALDGVSVTGGNGLTFASTAANSQVRGLAIVNFPGDGIDTEAPFMLIRCNHIGTGPNGNLDLGNGTHGIHVKSQQNQIGGTLDQNRNVISGNDVTGIYFIEDGIVNTVFGNYVGTSADGLSAIPNGAAGIRLNGVDSNQIGGANLGEPNVISGNGGYGVHIRANSFMNGVYGNVIGLDRTGTAVLANAASGVYIRNSLDNFIGLDAAYANTIAGNGEHGVSIFESAFQNYVGYNYIGVDATGTPFPNGGNGVLIDDSSAQYVYNNTIAHNGENGVEVLSSTSLGNTLTENAIYANTDLGIDHGGAGVTPNDPNDVDLGPNHLQNYPVLTSALGDLRVEGTLDSAPGSTFELEFFLSDTCDASGYGEGAEFVGRTTVMTDGAGDATFSVDLATTGAAGRFVTATARNAIIEFSTSEFSACLEVAADDIVYLSPDAFGTTDDGVAYEPGDILRYEMTLDRFTVFFDGSEYGVGSDNIDAFHIVESTGNIAISYDAPVAFGFPVGTAEPQDAVLFNPALGTFLLVFDGSDVDLTAADENIDAMSALPDGRVVFNLAGNYSVPGFGGDQGDILLFDSPTWGPVTSGTWVLYYDAPATATIDGMFFASLTEAYVSFSGPFAGFDDNDITRCVGLVCDPALFDGDVAGLGAGVDALQLDLAGAALAAGGSAPFQPR